MLGPRHATAVSANVGAAAFANMGGLSCRAQLPASSVKSIETARAIVSVKHVTVVSPDATSVGTTGAVMGQVVDDGPFASHDEKPETELMAKGAVASDVTPPGLVANHV